MIFYVSNILDGAIMFVWIDRGCVGRIFFCEHVRKDTNDMRSKSPVIMARKWRKYAVVQPRSRTHKQQKDKRNANDDRLR